FQYDASQPSKFKQTAQFTPYGSFKGGAEVAVGDVPGQTPIIVTAPGPGAALPVKIYTVAQTASGLSVTDTKQDFCPYGTNYSDGMVVAVGNLYHNTFDPVTKKQITVATNDIMTGPEAGDPLIDIFRPNATKPIYSSHPNFSFLAFRSGSGTQLPNGTPN